MPHFCLFCRVTVDRMSSDDFYGPALPPGFTKAPSDAPSDTPSAEVPPGSRHDRKRRHSSPSSLNSSSSSHDSDRPDGGSRRLSEKDDDKSSERLFGPALPAEFSPGGESTPPPKQSSFIGPVLPPTATTTSVAPAGQDDDEDDFGPTPALDTKMKTQSTIEEIESRAKLMKDKLEGKVFSVVILSLLHRCTCVLCYYFHFIALSCISFSSRLHYASCVW